MSIIETFYVLFKGDTSDLEKGTQKAKASTDKLNESLKSTDFIGQRVGSSFGSLLGHATGALAAIFSVGTIISSIKAAAHYADQLDELSTALNVNIEELDAWGNAVKLNGGSTESFQQTIKGLAASFADFATKGHSRVAPFFQELGIRMTDTKGNVRDVLTVLPELADRFSQLSKTESFGLGQKMGLDQGTIMLLQRGRREVEDVITRMKELGVTSKQDAEIAAKFNDQMDYTSIAFRSLFVSIGSIVLPIFTKIVKAFESFAIFARTHSHAVKGALYGIAGALTAVAIAALPAALPFILIGAAIATLIGLVAVIYDDIMNFLEGNKSVIGFILQKWPVIGQIFQGIVQAVKLLKAAFLDLGHSIMLIWDGIVSGVKSAIEFINNAVEKIVNAYQKVKPFLGVGKSEKDLQPSLEMGQRSFEVANNFSLARPASSLMNRSTNVSLGSITVNTQATDADGIASAIGVSLSTQLRQAVNSFDDGVAI